MDRNEKIFFLREVQFLKAISHPLITKFIGFSLTDFVGESRPVIIREYLPNNSLMEVLLNEKSCQLPRIWTDTKKLINIYGIAAGMSFLHSNNIIHGDLCPNNVLETYQFYPKICDFHSLSFDKSTAMFIYQLVDNGRGTMFYNAPEVISDSLFDYKSDVYSFGMTVYSIMTNKLPFDDLKDSHYFIMNEIIKGRRPELDENVPERYRRLKNVQISNKLFNNSETMMNSSQKRSIKMNIRILFALLTRLK